MRDMLFERVLKLNRRLSPLFGTIQEHKPVNRSDREISIVVIKVQK